MGNLTKMGNLIRMEFEEKKKFKTLPAWFQTSNPQINR